MLISNYWATIHIICCIDELVNEIEPTILCDDSDNKFDNDCSNNNVEQELGYQYFITILILSVLFCNTSKNVTRTTTRETKNRNQYDDS